MKLGSKLDQLQAVLNSIVTHRDSAAAIPAALAEAQERLDAAIQSNLALTAAETAEALATQ